MQKRGQVTTAIIFGFLIVLAMFILLSLVLYSQQQSLALEQAKVQKMNVQSLKIIPYIEECIKQQVIIATFLVSQQESSRENFTLPALNELEAHIQNYVEDNLALCPNFSMFKDLEIEPGTVDAEVLLQQQQFLITVQWPMKIIDKDLTVQKKQFRAEVPVSFFELYQKVKQIVLHNQSLDLVHILQQEMNIEIHGCVDDHVRLIVNDGDYLIDKFTLRFLFHDQLENISDFFTFEDKLIFNPYHIAGKHVLRASQDSKRIIFETNSKGVVQKCYDSYTIPEYYIFGLVRQQTIPIALGTSVPKRITIETKENNIFTFSAGYQLNNGTLYTPRAAGDVYELQNENNWKLLESEEKDNLLITPIIRFGTYKLSQPRCSQEEKAVISILFVPVGYDDLKTFYADVTAAKQTFLSVSPINQYKQLFSFHTYNELFSCPIFGSGNCTINIISEATKQCGEIYWVVLLDHTAIHSFEHETQQDVSFVNYYVKEKGFCNECNLLHEFGHRIGLNHSEGFRLRQKIIMNESSFFHYPLDDYVLPPVQLVWGNEETIGVEIIGVEINEERYTLTGIKRSDGAYYAELDPSQYDLHAWNDLVVEKHQLQTTFFPINTSIPVPYSQGIMAHTQENNLIIDTDPYVESSSNLTEFLREKASILRKIE